MTDDELMEALRHTASPLDAEAPVLERLTFGRLSPEEHQALERRAASEPDLARAVAAHRPLSSDARAKLAERLEASIRAAPTEAGRPTGGTWFGWGRQRWGLGVGLASGAAAAFFLLVFFVPAPAALPEYAFEVVGADRPTRGEAAAPERTPSRWPVVASSPLTLRARPRVGAGPVTAALFRLDDRGRLEPVAARPRVSDQGAVELRGTPAEWVGRTRGEVDLLLVVARAGHLPSLGDLARSEGAASAAQDRVLSRWQRIRLRVLEPPP